VEFWVLCWLESCLKGEIRSARCGKSDSTRYEVASCQGSVLRDAEVRVAVETNARNMRGSIGASIRRTDLVLLLPGWTCFGELAASVVIVISNIVARGSPPGKDNAQFKIPTFMLSA
jgi:hypothetical protein